MEIIALALILLILFAGTSAGGGRSSARRLPESTEHDWHVVKYRRHHPWTISPSNP
jgi:hypothetical protein